ncbi:hypothetical protein BYZ73_19770 [Rhodovulum viride]|uniref:Uncharacterized protein n=1 Tax=Rhodovulum viride TaxID=1231134 RepID=A0ABX9DE00_9RHOB|nr:hypothetical protein [Rhodovulum viride]RAP39573.1 hypothetical protein BYZ73_19770 [Rhodovulum viride]
MTYAPSADDLIYLARFKPENFSSPYQTIASLRDGDPVVEDITVANHYADYLRNGGQPLTETPIPADADADADGVIDPEFAVACPDCETTKPCCITAGSITDAADGSRQLLWPVGKDGPRRMLVVADSMEGRHLSGKVRVDWSGREACPQGWPDRPAIGINANDFRRRQRETSGEAAVGLRQTPMAGLAFQGYVPKEVVAALYAFDAIMALQNLRDSRDGASFEPKQCIGTGLDMGTPLKVIPVPKVALEGSVEVFLHVTLALTGIFADAGISGSMTGRYGTTAITVKETAKRSGGNPSATGGESSKVSPPGEKEENGGVIGLMQDMFGKINRYMEEGADSSDKSTKTPLERARAAARFTSAIEFSQKLEFGVTGLDLVPKSGSPDLLLKLGGAHTTLGIGVTGRLDILDMVATCVLTPASAKLLKETRVKIADGKVVNGTVEAFLELSSNGQVGFAINGTSGITIPADPDVEAELDLASSQTLSGEVKIGGKAEIKLHIEGKVWVLAAKAGVRGTIHTSWTWAARIRDGKRERNHEFEGLTVSGEAYVETKIIGDSGDDVRHAESEGASFGGKATRDLHADDVFESVQENITRANEQYATRQGMQPAEGGKNGYTLWDPVPAKWVAY